MELEVREDGLTVTRLPVEQMGSLALGLALTDEEGAVLRALLEGKRVRVLESGLEYKDYCKRAPMGVPKIHGPGAGAAGDGHLCC